MVSKSIREQARAVIISLGGGYYRRLLDATGVESFSDLSCDTLLHVVREAGQLCP